MHPNPAFRSSPQARNLAFAQSRGFGVLSINAPAGPLLSHVPFLLSEDGKAVDLHLVRSNPIARTPSGDAVIAVSGPDAYISPDWYDLGDQVPTWNYVAVHLRGHLERLPDDALPDLLARQSAAYEARLAPKPAWTMDKMTEATRARFLRAILPFRMTISEVNGTWKLGQNKPEPARKAAALALGGGFGAELSDLERLMLDPDEHHS